MIDRINDWFLSLATRRWLLKGFVGFLASIPAVLVAYGAARAQGWQALLIVLGSYAAGGIIAAFLLRHQIWPDRPTPASKPSPIEGTIYASGWRRLGGFLIDAVILLFAGGLVGAAVANGATEGSLYSFSRTVVAAIYFLIGNYYGVTPGKWLAKIRVVRGDASQPGLQGGVRRTLPSLVAIPIAAISVVPHGATVTGYIDVVLYLGFATLVWDSNKQSLYDKLAGTFVVMREARSPMVSQTV